MDHLDREGADGRPEPLPDVAGQHVGDRSGGGMQRSPPSESCDKHECSQEDMGGGQGNDEQTLLGRDEKRSSSCSPWRRRRQGGSRESGRTTVSHCT